MLVCDFSARSPLHPPDPKLHPAGTTLHPAGSALRSGRLLAPSQTSTVDLLHPEEVQRRLAMTGAALRLLVNRGALAAYDIGGAIRFRATDVNQLEAQLTES